MSLTHFINAFRELLLPPWSPLLLLAAGAWRMHRRQAGGRPLALAGLVLLLLGANTLLALLLTHALEVAPLRPADATGAGAIVVPGAGTYRDAPEFGADDVAGRALERLRMAARLHRATGLPVLVSGGVTSEATASEAAVMAGALERDFGVRVTWREERALNTLENARHSARILLPLGIRRVLLVTHAWHLPRALWAFRRAGLDPVPVGLGYDTRTAREVLNPLPSLDALVQQRLVLHEVGGLAWYRLRCAVADCR